MVIKCIYMKIIWVDYIFSDRQLSYDELHCETCAEDDTYLGDFSDIDCKEDAFELIRDMAEDFNSQYIIDIVNENDKFKGENLVYRELLITEKEFETITLNSIPLDMKCINQKY